VRLAYGGPPKALRKAFSLAGPGNEPGLLVSYWYIKGFMDEREHYHFRDWVMDSGAFSAANSGKVIDLQEYTEFCLKMMAEDEKLSEIYSLDVIGDWKGTRKNTEAMWAEGVPAIPTFHIGQPWDVLIGMAEDFPKIALGGMAGLGGGRQSVIIRWLGQCFARVWPKPIHGFAACSKKALRSFPFHSVDASSWELGPTKYGNWKSLGGYASVRGSEHNLRSEVDWWLQFERAAQARWMQTWIKADWEAME
jgi:hypothetical protein